jgi:hypothetical protein
VHLFILVWTYLDVTVEGKTRRTLDQTVQLGTAKVLGKTRELLDVNIVRHDAVDAHLAGMDVQDLYTTLLVGQRDFNVDLESTGTQERFVDHVESVRHTDDQDVVELFDTVHLAAQYISGGT